MKRGDVARHLGEENIEAPAGAEIRHKQRLSTGVSADGVNGGFDNNFGILLSTLDQFTKFSDYEGPAPGFVVEPVEVEPNINVARNYFPKPSLLQGASEDGLGRSRNALDGGELKLNEEYSAFERGIYADTSDARSVEDDTVEQGSIGDEDSEELLTLPRPTELAVIPAPQKQPTIGVDEVELLSLVEPETVSVIDTPTFFPRARIAPTEPENSLRRKYKATLELTAEELELARHAWRYLENNRQTNTGFFNSVDKYPFTTMWDMGSSLAALYSANAIGILSEQKFNEYLTRLLHSMEQMPLYDGEVPNREYDTRSALMTNLRNQPSDKGSGYSTIDIGRTLIWLRVITSEHPEFEEAVIKVTDRWNLKRLSTDGEFYREILGASKVDRKQEGRLGYEQYTGLALSQWGEVVSNAMDLAETEEVTVEGIPILRDVRDPDFYNIEPFLLIGMEFSSVLQELSHLTSALISVHMKRYERTDELAVFAEDSTDVAPWFLYNIISSDDGNWICKNYRGDVVERCQTFSTKAAFAASVLYDTKFTDALYDQARENFDIRLGFYAGIFEDGDHNRAYTGNTNAVILESLPFKMRGGEPFLSSRLREDYELSRSRLAN